MAVASNHFSTEKKENTEILSSDDFLEIEGRHRQEVSVTDLPKWLAHFYGSKALEQMGHTSKASIECQRAVDESIEFLPYLRLIFYYSEGYFDLKQDKMVIDLPLAISHLISIQLHDDYPLYFRNASEQSAVERTIAVWQSRCGETPPLTPITRPDVLHTPTIQTPNLLYSHLRTIDTSRRLIQLANGATAPGQSTRCKSCTIL